MRSLITRPRHNKRSQTNKSSDFTSITTDLASASIRPLRCKALRSVAPSPPPPHRQVLLLAIWAPNPSNLCTYAHRLPIGLVGRRLARNMRYVQTSLQQTPLHTCIHTYMLCSISARWAKFGFIQPCQKLLRRGWRRIKPTLHVRLSGRASGRQNVSRHFLGCQSIYRPIRITSRRFPLSYLIWLNLYFLRSHKPPSWGTKVPLHTVMTV